MLKLFEKDENYEKVKDGYAKLIENERSSEITKYNRGNLYI